MTVQPPAAPLQPSLSWRASSAALMGVIGSLSRIAMFGANRTEVHGLDRFKSLLDERQDPKRRKRGLITVSNHTSVVDDPFLWGTLPFKYSFQPNNHRWTLGSYDICFQSKGLSTFFNLGQLLPTHRKKHSAYGGLFQPTMTEAIRLLNDCPVVRPPEPPQKRIESVSASSTRSLLNSTSSSSSSSTTPTSAPEQSFDFSDPFSSASLTYTTNGHDSFPRPSAYASRRYSWIHIFPEGFVHQHPERAMRYFKWGVARLILEADECPDVIPIWHEGTEKIMAEDRGWPRPVPRLFQEVGIWFGDNVAGARSADEGNVFAELRGRWHALVARERSRLGDDTVGRPETLTDALKFGREAVNLRVETAMKVREAVLDVRRRRGLPDEDPKARLVDTYREEQGEKGSGHRPDGSWVKDV